MFVHSKNKNEKIILGLLSYTLAEQSNSTELLPTILANYQQNENKDFLLYRTQENENYIGLIGIEQHHDSESGAKTLIIDRVALLPSFRHESLGYQMFCELKQLYSDYAMIGSQLTAEWVMKWSMRYDDEYGNNRV